MKPVWLSGRWGELTAMIAGAALPLALAPFDLVWIAPLSIIALLLVTGHAGLPDSLTVPRLFLRYLFFGVGYFGVGASWVYVSIHDYGYTSVPFALFLTVLWVVGLALVFALPWLCWSAGLKKWQATARLRWLVLLGFPAAWVLNEWMRTWLLTGFPWLFVGYSQTETGLGGWAPVAGVYGVGFLVVLLASAMLGFMHRRNSESFIILLFVAMVAIGGGDILSRIEWTKVTQELQQSVVLVQGNVAQEQKWRPEQREAIRTLYRRLSEPLFHPGQLVVWPEAAIPELYTESHPFFAEMRNVIAGQGGALITGVPSAHRDADGERIYHNSLLGLGEASGFYHKRRLVPFGEYVPLQTFLKGLLDFFKLPISDFRTGPVDQANLSIGHLKAAGSICYEIAYPDLVASQAASADFLLTVSNDSWFGASIGPHQHLQMAQMRARENSRELVRATSNGISAFVDAKGLVLSRSPQFEVATLHGNIHPHQGITPFQRFGSAPVVVGCALLLMLLFRRERAAS